MSVSVAVVAGPAAAGVAGLEGSFEWGDATTGAAPAAPTADLVMALGDAATEREPDVRWLGDPPAPAGSAGRIAATRGAPAPAATAARVVATHGAGLWSRAPWPVRDELFELDRPDPGAGLLVVSSDQERDAALLEKLAARGLPLAVVPELTAEALAAAGAVALPPDRGEAGAEPLPGARQEAVPAASFAALAARRPLIAPRARVTFGLLPGVDHLAASTDDDVVQYADALHAFADVFGAQVALGRVAAERQRASTVYGRLVADLLTEAAR